MPRSILSQRDQWPDRYADNNLIESPVETDEVNNPAATQNDNDFSNPNMDNIQTKKTPSVSDLASAVQQEKGMAPQVPGENKIPGGGGGAAPAGGGSATGVGSPAGGGSAVGVPGAPGGGPPSQSLTEALTRAGIDPQLHPLISGFSATEGNNPSGAPTLGFTDSQAGSSLDQHAQALAKQLKDRQSVAGPFPAGKSPQEQASWMATVVGQNGSPSDWQGNAQPARSTYVNNIVKSMPAAAPAAATPLTTNAAPAINKPKPTDTLF